MKYTDKIKQVFDPNWMQMVKNQIKARNLMGVRFVPMTGKIREDYSNGQ